ncbi:PAS domain-containing hybrid sensor histidine kinase/response regulator [Pedobacter mendelii]|uniref:histidine kinase n=1 Tax=Pedobacter mendelii TaxID=1908240 RepID=A0ABQ2BG94_9SPHI|nr:response regulator [Pedobacter mendelii]GGI25376.1 hypothetical protein GCM10008119_17350 [Pedobacter mendelii]
MSIIYKKPDVSAVEMSGLSVLLALSKTITETQICEISISQQIDSEWENKYPEKKFNAYESSLIGMVHSTGQVFCCEDIQNDFTNAEGIINERKINFYAGFPLVDERGNIYGVLNLMDFQKKILASHQLQSMILLSEEISRLLSMHLKNLNNPDKNKLLKKGKEATLQFEQILDIIGENELLKFFFDHSNELICSHTTEGNLITVNNAAAENLGYSVEELLRLSLFDLVPQAGHTQLRQYLQSVITKGFASGQMLVVGKNKKIRVWKYRNIYIQNFSSSPYIIGNAFDITDQHLIEKDLKFTQQILEQTNKVARVGGWDFDIKLQKIYWTTMTKVIHEVDDSYIPNLTTGINFYKAGESRETITRSIENALKTGAGFDHELQIITALGNDIWVRALGNAEFEEGKCIRLFGTFQDIDSQKKSSIALAEAKKMLDNVLKSASEISIIATDLNGTITLFNSGAEIMLGYAAVEMIGKHNVDIVHDAQEMKKREQEISIEIGRKIEGFEVFTAMTKLNNSEKRDWTYIKKDGTRLTVSLVVTPVKDSSDFIVGYLGIANDITQSKIMETALESQRARLTAFVKHAPAAVAMLDNNMRYIAVSNQWIEDYRIGKREVLGLSHYEIFPNLGRNRLIRHQNVLNGAIEKKEEDIYIVPDSLEKKYISWEMRPWFNDQKIEGMMIFTRDITEMVKYREDLKLAKIQAEAASIAKSEFLANMSHEIRTPLNGVIGFTDLILKTKLNDTQHQYLSIASQSANSLLNIINDILDFSKIEAGKLELDNEKFDIYEIISQSSEIIDYQIKSKGLEMLINIPLDFPRFIWGDSNRLKQVLVNLLGNAVKFTKQGEIELKLELLSSSELLSEIRFSVRDTGIGIPDDKKIRIFKAFSQADNSTTRKYGGTGLGLNISNKLLKLMDSKLCLVSEADKGSTFYFDVTLKSERGITIQWENIGEVKKILVVDDNANNRTIIHQMLSSQGIKSIQAATGEAALDIIKADETIDVVLMDYQMPGLNGIETAENIRMVMAKNGNELPIILLHSSAEDSSIRKSCEKLDIRQRLSKPLKIEQLLSALSHLKIKDVEDEKNDSSLYSKTNNTKIDILVAEDDDFNMFLITTILHDIMPFANIIEAKNGFDAVNMAKEKMPSIVLMDIRMPVMDGYQATKEIRLLTNGGQLPIIAATAGNAKNEEEHCLSCGMNDYLTKPYKEEQILEVLEKWLALSFN